MSTSNFAFHVALKKAKNGPCDTCDSRQRCADQNLACRAFSRFVETGVCNVSERDEPTCRRYLNIFGDVAA